MTSLCVGLALLVAGSGTARLAGQTRGPVSMAAMRTQCIEFTDVNRGGGAGEYRECRVSEFGEIGTVGSTRFYYVLYCLLPNETAANARCGDDSFIARYHRARGMAVFAREASGQNVHLVFNRASEEIGTVFYQRPEIVQNAAGTLLYLPIVIDGTSGGNVSEYYQQAADRWALVDSKTWLADLHKRLPAGLEVRQGVWPDLRTMRAEAGLYRVADANCCPTGGTVRLGLVVRARRFVIDSFVIEPVR